MVTPVLTTKPRAGNRARIVPGRVLHGDAVRHEHLLAQTGAYAGRKRAEADHRTLDVADPNVLASAECARVHQDESARSLSDDPRCANRDHQSEQHRDALERLGVSTRQIREGQRDSNRPDDDLEDAARRCSGVFVQAAHRDAAAFDAVEEQFRDPDDHAGDQQDHQDDQESRNCPDHRQPDVAGQPEQVPLHVLAPWPGVGKLGESESEPAVGGKQGDDPGEYRERAPGDPTHLLRVEQAHAVHVHLLCARAGDEPTRCPAQRLIVNSSHSRPI